MPISHLHTIFYEIETNVIIYLSLSLTEIALGSSKIKLEGYPMSPEIWTQKVASLGEKEYELEVEVSSGRSWHFST